MGLGGRVDRELYRTCRPGSIPPGRVRQADGELILIGEFAGNSLAGWKSNGDGCSSVLGIEHALFKFQSTITPGDAGQIASRRMAGRAGPSAIEILFARL